MDAKLLVLRFRDIERELNETINEHREVIQNRGGVWWGWLHRPYEAIPLEYLKSFNPKKTAASVDVALYDTGQGKVFLAKCDEVEVYDYPQTTPAYEVTPSYYNAKETSAWFHFTSIDDSSPDLLLGRTCLLMPSATKDCAVDILGSQITRLNELRRQEVTMWVLS